MRPGVLLDRDGTIIVDHGFVGSVDRVEMVPGTPEAIAKFNRTGVPVAVITNQSGVARGYFGVGDIDLVHEHISDLLSRAGAHIDLYLSCPYHPEGVVKEFSKPSEDRKPSPGMALKAAEVLDLDLRQSWVVGDSHADMELAEAVGAYAAWVGAGTYARSSVRSFSSLPEAVPYILQQMDYCLARSATARPER